MKWSVSFALMATAALLSGPNPTARGEPMSAVSVRGHVEGGGDELALGASTTGTIAQMLVKSGDHVEAGQVLLRVDCRDLENEIAARQADLAVSDAILALTTRGFCDRAVELSLPNNRFLIGQTVTVKLLGCSS
jgi:multidrug efflux pump subunit AcrA (membrane-fusion protein)